MRKLTKYIAYALSFVMLTSLSSCLINDDDVEITPECYITSFSVGDITTYLTTTSSTGSDSTYSRTVSGSSVKFNIDQVNGLIYSVDSLPSWINLTRVVPTINYNGTLYARLNLDDNFYAVSSGSDSIDFSQPMDFLVKATDGISSKKYTVTIHKYTANKDSILWDSLGNANLKFTDIQKLLVANNNFYAFAQYNGNACLSTSEDGINWTEPKEFKTVANNLDCKSILIFNDKFYSLNENGYIYSSEDGIEWTIASDKTVSKLLASDDFYIYALADNGIIASKDLSSWEINGSEDLNMIPEKNISSVAYSTRTNAGLEVNVMAGISSNNADNAVVWYKVASNDDISNQTWDYITITDENPYPLPILSNLQIFHYYDALYAIGGDNDYLYKSEDNGITWRQMTEYQYPPKGLVADKNVSVVVKGYYIWMIQTNAQGEVKVWKGVINRLS